MVSPYRNKILELFDEGLVGKDEIFTNLLNFLSESDAKEFWEQYYEEDEPYGRDDPYEDEEDEDKVPGHWHAHDGQPDEDEDDWRSWTQI